MAARITYGAVSSWEGPGIGRGAALTDCSETRHGPSWAYPSRRLDRNTVLGQYRLIEKLGEGRQAHVWRALRTDQSAGEVALKVLPASARDPRRRAQLRHEAERGTRLVGPSLLTTSGFGEADGAVFMAMPLVIGGTLAELLDQRRSYCRDGWQPRGAHRLAMADDRSYTRDVVDLIVRVARAAAGAHAGRVVHRDIKPGNILVGRDHADGVYLCDFGLARDLDIATPRQLRDGAGSPLYMAPERLLKRPADEVRADVYALGATLFEALTLTPPIDVPTDLPQPLWATFLAATPPRRPSAVWPMIPASLEAAIVRATAFDPARRHHSAEHFAADLERFLSDSEPCRTFRRLGAHV